LDDDDENGSGAVRSTSGMMLIVPSPSEEAGRKGRPPLPAPAPVAAAAADPSPHIAHFFRCDDVMLLNAADADDGRSIQIEKPTARGRPRRRLSCVDGSLIEWIISVLASIDRFGGGVGNRSRSSERDLGPCHRDR
jgi:hypothetical protein